jgi:TPR repeat protein
MHQLSQPYRNYSLAISASALALTGVLACSKTSAAEGGADLSALLDGDDVRTQTQWAQRFEHGEAQDFDHAIQLYCRAARAGHLDVRHQLGWMYSNSRGVARDDGQAAAWFELPRNKEIHMPQECSNAYRSQAPKRSACDPME